MATRSLESLVARGNTSDVYAWGTDAVIKVLRPGIPDAWASREAETTRLVHDAGLPAPAVLDLTTVNGRPGIVLEQIRGASMWDQMLARPDDIPRLAGTLAELQSQINNTPVPAGLPRLVDRLGDNISKAPLLSASEREHALSELNSLPPAHALCHFDVHPNNVLMSDREPMVIDWFDAAAGSPAADIVRASVLMRRDAADAHLPCSDPSLVAFLHDQYLAAVARVRDIDPKLLLSWESPVLAGRLAEPIVKKVRRTICETWQARHASLPTELEVGLRSALSRDSRAPERMPWR